MIGRFLTYLIFFVIVSGLILHFDVEVPYFSTWMGHLPGDLILTKGKVIIYLPFTTSGIVSVGLCLFSSLFSAKR